MPTESLVTARSPLLNACRELMLHRSSLQLANALDRLAESLLENATKAFEPKIVGGLLDARSLLQSTRPDISEAFSKELGLRLEGKKTSRIPTNKEPDTPSEGGLSLQSDEVLDEYVAAQTLARSIESASLAELPVLHQRLLVLYRTPGLKLEDDPYGPQSIVSALLDALQSVDASPEVRLHWIRGLVVVGGQGYSDIYADLNRHLAAAGVHPNRPQPVITPTRATPAAGGHAAQTPGVPGAVGAAGVPGGMAAGYGPAAAGAGAGYAPGGHQLPNAFPGADEYFPEASFINPSGFESGSFGGAYAQPGYGMAAGFGGADGGSSVQLQAVISNLVSLIERLQSVMPPMQVDGQELSPGVAGMARSRQAMQISAALGFAGGAGGGEGEEGGATLDGRPLVTAPVDPKLIASLTNLQQRAAATFRQLRPEEQKKNVLREVVPGYVDGDMSMLDATTTELVAMLFDYVLARNELRDEIKVLIGRLQIPMLKAAMVDRGFFSRKNHPARQLLNRLADAGMSWTPEEGTQDGAYHLIDTLTERINQDFVEDLGVFTEALVEVEAWITEQEQKAQPIVERETVAAAELDRVASAQKVVDDAIRERTQQHALPQPVLDFIEKAWRLHLIERYLDHGDTEPYQTGLATMDDLIWSVMPRSEPMSRSDLTQRVPAMVRRLREGLQSQPPELVSTYFDKLLEVHAGLMHGAHPDYIEPVTEEAELDTFELLVKQIERNQWIELSDENGALTYAKLAWLSPQGTTYLFTTRSGRKAATVSPQELADMFRTDRARLIESEPIVDRALAEMFLGA